MKMGTDSNCTKNMFQKQKGIDYDRSKENQTKFGKRWQ